MSAERRSKIGLVLLVFVLHAALIALRSDASVTSALINKALDSQQKLDLDTTLPQAMTQIGNMTGVRIEADPAVWDLLPWGEQTNITAKIENHTLRYALTAITEKLGLEYALTDEAVELRPMPALRRLGRRSTVQELAALDLLNSTPMNIGGDHPTVRELLTAVDSKLDAAKSPFAVENRAPDATQDRHVAVARNMTMAEALEAMVHQTNATWYPWGNSLVVVPKREQLRTQLGKTLTARYRSVDVGQVLMELFQRAGVDFTVDPGSYQHIPSAYRNITLMLDNATIQQALQTIGGYTGLGFEVNDDGVRVWNQLISPATAPTTNP
jgi:hypothetical protein